MDRNRVIKILEKLAEEEAEFAEEWAAAEPKSEPNTETVRALRLAVRALRGGPMSQGKVRCLACECLVDIREELARPGRAPHVYEACMERVCERIESLLAATTGWEVIDGSAR